MAASHKARIGSAEFAGAYPLRRRRLPSQSGQSLLEFALLLPFLVIMLLGVIELGRFAYTGILVTSAARAGAAYASQGISQSTDTSGIQAAADNDYTNNGGDAGTLAVSSSHTCGCDSGGAFTTEVCTGTGAGTCSPGHWVVNVSVTASGTYTPLFNYPGIMTSAVAVTKTATMRVAQYGD